MIIAVGIDTAKTTPAKTYPLTLDCIIPLIIWPLVHPPANLAPIQGSAADIIKIAMINVHKKLEENNLKSKLILQVHDELIVEAIDDEIDIVKKIVKEEMENAVNMDVHLDVDLNVGSSWYETK